MKPLSANPNRLRSKIYRQMAKRMEVKKHKLLSKCNPLFVEENRQHVQTRLLPKNTRESPGGWQRAPPARAAHQPHRGQSQSFSLGSAGRTKKAEPAP